MKKPLSGVLAAVLSLSLLLPAAVTAAGAEEAPAAAPTSIAYGGAFYYRPGEAEITALSDNVDTYIYSDAYFMDSGKVFHPHLATLSMSLAEASASSAREACTTDGYTRKSRNVTAFLEDNGFSDIALNRDYTIKPTKDTIGVACAHKRITDGGKTYTLLAVVPRSAGYEMEWGNNFLLGSEGDAAGFHACADACLAFTKAYMTQNGLTGALKLWTTGYSRGGAVVNLMAKQLIDDPQRSLGDAVTLTPDNLYAYTFGTPNAAFSADARDEAYAGIFNLYEDSELAAAMAPAAMGFERYGTDIMIKDDTRREEMLRHLAICNPALYEAYSGTSGSYRFTPKKLGISGGSVSLTDDPDSYIPRDAAAFLQGLQLYLTQITGGRERYAAVYEDVFSELIGYCLSLTPEEAAAFRGALLSGDAGLDTIAGLYAYFMRVKSETPFNGSRAQLVAKSKELASVAAPADNDGVGIDSAQLLKLAAKLAVYLATDAETLKPQVAQKLGVVLDAALTATGAPQETKDKLMTPEALDKLVYLFSHILFGNIWQSDAVHPLLLNNEQMKNAATLAGNVTNLIYDHLNEVIVSWLRTNDSHFDDDRTLSDTQAAGYRRVYLTAGDPAALNGKVLDHSGSTVGVIENGVLTASQDKWVGFTTTDDGGFFRIPLGEAYTIQLNDCTGTVSACVGEYNVFTAQTAPAFSDSATVEQSGTITLTLPALTADTAMPSGAAYTLTASAREKDYQKGDVDLDGKVTINDVTLLQRKLAELTELSERQVMLADVNGDGVLSVEDATIIQRFLAEFDVTIG